MSLCSCDTVEFEWTWWKHGEPKPFDLKRRQRCLNCKQLIDIGAECQEIARCGYDENGDEKDLASKYLCEECNDLSMAIEELNGCYTLGGLSLKEQIREANDDL
jgi:hypothetical protein